VGRFDVAGGIMKRFLRTYYPCAGAWIGGVAAYFLTGRKWPWWEWLAQGLICLVVAGVCYWNKRQRDELEKILWHLKHSLKAERN